MSRSRIVVADALPIFRAGVRNVLRREREFDVVEAGSFGELADVLGRDAADIALVDAELPPRGGVEAVRRLCGRTTASLIVWSFDPTPELVLAAVRAGARGFLRKDIAKAGFVRALRGAQHGEAQLSRELVGLMIEALHDLDEQERARARASTLSHRESEVLDLLAGGARNKDIASALGISEFTVKRHVQNVLCKLELPSRRAAAAFHAVAFAREEAALVRP